MVTRTSVISIVPLYRLEQLGRQHHACPTVQIVSPVCYKTRTGVEKYLCAMHPNFLKRCVLLTPPTPAPVTHPPDCSSTKKKVSL